MWRFLAIKVWAFHGDQALKNGANAAVTPVDSLEASLHDRSRVIPESFWNFQVLIY